MSDIHVKHDHALGLPRARELATDWINGASKKLGLTCRHEPGDTTDTIHFERPGLTGTMHVSGEAFELRAKLGLMFAAMKPFVESEIDRNLQALLAKGGGPAAA